VETAYEKVTAALSACGSIRRGNNWNCPGPLHGNDDRRPSLQVTRNNVGVGLYCHAGCGMEEIVEALGLSVSDLFDKTDPRPVAHYDYKDLDGTILFRKTRFEPKDFRISHPNGNGWEPRIGNAKPVLYRLPELKEAIARGETVYVVEGEKDVDTLAEHDVAATCNYEGAGKWLDSYSQHFNGAKVVVIADRDDAGYIHAKKVKASLIGTARSVHVMQSAVTMPKADVTDHFAAGFTIEDLVPLNGAFKPVSLGNLVAKGVKEPDFLADGMLYRGGLHCIAGAPDSGKTTIALYWAVQVMNNGGRVAFFDEEGGQDIIAEKLISMGVRNTENLLYVPFPGKMWDDSDVEALIEFLSENQPDMVLWDSSAAFLARAGLDENSAPAVTSWWSRVLMPLARDLNAAVLVIDHDTKSSEQSRYARGSGAKLAVLDVQYKVEIQQPFSRVQNGLLKFMVTKDRRGYLHRGWLVQVNSGRMLELDFVHENDDGYVKTMSPSKRKIYGVLTAEQSLTNKEVLELVHENFPDETPMVAETVSRALNDLMREGWAQRSGSETRASWRKLRLLTGMVNDDEKMVNKKKLTSA
jgi:hypothetical protein